MGVFLSAHQDSRLRLTPSGELAVSSVQPWIWVDLEVARPDDPAETRSWIGAVPAQNDIVVIGSDTYRVYDVQPDGFGATTLILKRK